MSKVNKTICDVCGWDIDPLFGRYLLSRSIRFNYMIAGGFYGNREMCTVCWAKFKVWHKKGLGDNEREEE